MRGGNNLSPPLDLLKDAKNLVPSELPPLPPRVVLQEVKHSLRRAFVPKLQDVPGVELRVHVRRNPITLLGVEEDPVGGTTIIYVRQGDGGIDAAEVKHRVNPGGQRRADSNLTLGKRERGGVREG